MDWLSERVDGGVRIVRQLLEQPKTAITGPSAFPMKPGVYAFSTQNAKLGEFLRAGRSDDLQQRIYQNHLMGNQMGNLVSQLVKSGEFESREQAKVWVREHCVVQFLVIEDEEARRMAEYFVLAALKPRLLG